MPFNPTSGGMTALQPRLYEDYADTSQWQTLKPQFDAGRHFGSIGLAALMPDFLGQLKDIPQALDMQRMARSNLNELGTAAGRQKRVGAYGAQAANRAYESGKQMRAMFAARGQDIGESANIAALNQAARATNDYAATLESPESIDKIYQIIAKANSPDEVVSMVSLMLGLNEQDLPRYIAHLQDSASDRGGAFGKVLGALGNIVGMSSFGGAKALGGLAALGGSDAATGSLGQSMASKI